MALLRHTPLVRAVQLRALTISCSSSIGTTSTVALPPVSKNKQDSCVLLGMSELDLQQLAIDFGQEAGWSVGRSPIHKMVTAADGTVKLLIKLEDNRLVETVGIPVEDDQGSHRLTACVSSQVGCPLRCSFCATGKGGFSRNLKRHEIVEQVLAIEEIFNRRVTNVVFMGMGEPMLNLKEVLEAHRCLNKDIQIGQRMITISTVGVPNTIRKLASHKLQSTLALSCWQSHPLFYVVQLPPSVYMLQIRNLGKRLCQAKSYPLDAIMKDCKHYFLETGRRVSFEYTLLAGVNDTVEHATELAQLIHEWGSGYHVNLIPFNPIEGSEYQRPIRNQYVLAFSAALESRKVTVSVRQTRGLDASAACGQLRNEFQKVPLLAGAEVQQSELEMAVAS
ncbi:hypothetical protein DH2020_030348 [Rehmannia glutinosa]|uniref:Radical SAM core domain-containing protein n=1 Tax=Rehmannia glutinosa TaxID=99300 RepID=A0ABR0VL24_REHGL